MNILIKTFLLFAGMISVQNENVSFTALKIDCLSYPSKKEYHVITSQADYDALESYRRGPDCAPLTEVDFSEKILIGYPVVAGGCSAPTYTLRLMKQNGNYAAEVTVKENGICSVIIHDIFWFTIDKPGEPFAIKFTRAAPAKN